MNHSCNARVKTNGAALIDGPVVEIIPKHGQLTIRANGRDVDSPLGREGEFYFENISPGSYPAMLEYQEQSCQFNLTIPVSEESEIELGNVPCRR